MRETTFRWYLKKRLMAATPSGTLDLRVLGALAKRDPALRAALMLYVTGSVSCERAKRRLDADMLSEYGKYFYESGQPLASELAAMPLSHRAIYEDFQAYRDGRERQRRVKIRCRKRLLDLMRERGLSLRDVGRVGGINIGCISRFLNGRDYAIGADRLKEIIEMLGGDSGMDRVQIKDYSEKKLDDGMVEITFTLVMASDAADALDKICQENAVTLSGLVTLFLRWTAKNPDEAEKWLVKATKG